MILVMLNQRWIFKSVKYKNLGKNLYNKKKLADYDKKIWPFD